MQNQITSWEIRVHFCKFIIVSLMVFQCFLLSHLRKLLWQCTLLTSIPVPYWTHIWNTIFRKDLLVKILNIQMISPYERLPARSSLQICQVELYRGATEVSDGLQLIVRTVLKLRHHQTHHFKQLLYSLESIQWKYGIYLWREIIDHGHTINFINTTHK